MCPRVLRLRRRTAHARQLGSALRRGRSEDGRARLGRAGARQEQAGGGLPDERLRRSAGGLRHGASTSPACGPTTWCSTWPSRRCASGWQKATGHDARRRRRRCERAIGKLVRALHGARRPGLRDLAAARLRAAAEFATAAADTASGNVLAQGRGGRRATHGGQLANFVFWTLAEICAEYRLAVRPDDRRQPRRLSRRASTRDRTCTTAACR